MTPDDRRWPAGTFLHALAEDDRRHLLRLGTRRGFAPGTTLIDEGSTSTEAYVLLSGYVKVLGNTLDGRAVLLSIRGQGEVVGELAALDRKRRSATVLALTTMAAQVITQEVFLGYLRDHPAAAGMLQTATLEEFRRVTRYRLLVNGAPIGVRLALMLGHLLDHYGRRCAEGMRIDVPLSQPELASLIGASEPSLHRELTALRVRKIIGTRYRRLVVHDPDALRALTGSSP